MKVDIIVNSMLQQIDRNLQMQAMPALSFRPGEILQGRVMLTSDDKLQIRLDNGTLLNAIPAGNVILSPGATVTLRVSGRMDGQLVMQLLEQELTGEHPASALPSQEAADEMLAKFALDAAPQGHAVLQAMERMSLPIREETVRQALDILGQFPFLEPEKAVFMAVNRLPATGEQVEALNRLINGRATTGGEFLKLADILSTQALEAENMQIMEVLPQGAAAAGFDGMLKMQSLVFVALGVEAGERYSGVVSRLQSAGMLDRAVALVLEAPYMAGAEFDDRLQAFSAALPEDVAPEAREFIQKLASGLSNYISNSGPEVTALMHASELPVGIPRIIREIADLFVRLDRDSTGNAASLHNAAGGQQARLAHVAAGIESAGAASPNTARQISSIAGHVSLLENISQYNYQQIPVWINDRNRTVELYVMNRGKGGRKINSDNANILITLDTDNMGHIETLINVRNKGLRLSFGVEYPDLVGYIGNYTSEIGVAMQAIGYKLSDMRMQVISRAVTPLTASAVLEPAGKAGALDIRL